MGVHLARRAALAGVAAAAAAAILLGAAPAGDGAASASGGGTGGSHHAHRGGKPASPYRGDGMWIWYVSDSRGGDLSRIAHTAHRHGIETVYIKSSDGSSSWSQFTRGLVSYLHSRHLRVCGWQFVYGAHPSAEARRGAGAVRKGADCLVIDAESSYEGRYAAADTYMKKLRNRIGAGFPTALATFPYVDYHPSVPVLGLPRSPRRALQPAPALLAHDRDHGCRGLRAHVPVQSRLSPGDLPARADLRQSAAPPDPALSADGHLLRPRRRQLVVMAGDEQSRVAGARAQHRQGRRRHPPHVAATIRRSRRAVVATSSSGRRSTCGAPASRFRSRATSGARRGAR